MHPTHDHTQWFSEHIKPHEPMLRGYLSKRFPSLPDHDDIVQEAYSKLMRLHADNLPKTKSFLFTVARNVAIDMLRRRKVLSCEPISELTKLPVLHEEPGVPEALERTQRHEILLEAISSLPDRCREVVILRHVDGLSYKEIAERLGISPNTVKIHIVKGLKDCTAFFRSQGLLTNSAEHSFPSESAKEI